MSPIKLSRLTSANRFPASSMLRLKTLLRGALEIRLWENVKRKDTVDAELGWHYRMDKIHIGESGRVTAWDRTVRKALEKALEKRYSKRWWKETLTVIAQRLAKWMTIMDRGKPTYKKVQQSDHGFYESSSVQQKGWVSRIIEDTRWCDCWYIRSRKRWLKSWHLWAIFHIPRVRRSAYKRSIRKFIERSRGRQVVGNRIPCTCNPWQAALRSQRQSWQRSAVGCIGCTR